MADNSEEKPPAKGEIAKVVKLPSTQSATSKLVTPKELITRLEKLIAVFGRPAGWKIAAPLYLDALADLSSQELADAEKNLVLNHTGFFPKPAEIRQAAGRELDKPDDVRGWATHCLHCGCPLSDPFSRREGTCLTCSGRL